MKKKGCWIIGGSVLVIGILCLCVFSFFSLIIAAGVSDEVTQETVVSTGNLNEKIAIIDLNGVIISGSADVFGAEDDVVGSVLGKLAQVREDSSFKAVILRVNTPGGTVFDSDKIAKAIVKTKEAGKKVVVLMEDSATSGGYYVSAPADKIIASEVTVTGSIGVVTQIIKLDGLYEKLGVDVITITNTEGDVKTFENIDDPNSKDRAVLEELLDDNFETFIQVIIDNRDLTRNEVLALADGSIYSGKKALELGLVDELGDMDEAIAAAKKLAELSDPQIIELKDPTDFWDDLFSTQLFNPLGSVKRVENKLNSDPGVYTWYIVAD